MRFKVCELKKKFYTQMSYKKNCMKKTELKYKRYLYIMKQSM